MATRKSQNLNYRWLEEKRNMERDMYFLRINNFFCP